MLATFILISGNSYAEDIDNIFGFKLGSVIDHEKDNFVENVKNEKKSIYKIKFKEFDRATVSYTPTSKKIYEIKTEKSLDNKDSCIYELDIILGIMSKKYGAFKFSDFSDQIGEAIEKNPYIYKYYFISSKDQTLSVSCKTRSNYKYYISIVLNDESIENLGKQEQIDREAEYELKNL